MRRSFPGNLIIILSGLFLFILSCAPQSCFDETEAFFKATLYTYKPVKRQAPDSLTVYGINMGTDYIYDKAKNVPVAQFPLNADTTKCTFIIRINGITDTMEITYTNFPHLVSKECGYTFYHIFDSDSLSFTRNAIDSIYIRRNNITTIYEENNQIFY